jgi:hypothetical protein
MSVSDEPMIEVGILVVGVNLETYTPSAVSITSHQLLREVKDRGRISGFPSYEGESAPCDEIGKLQHAIESRRHIHEEEDFDRR